MITPLTKRCALLSLCVFAFVSSASPLKAHPHVFIESKTTIIINKNHEITGFRQSWIFDKQYTAFALVGMDVDKDGKYSQKELEPLAKENIESLHEYDFFTFASQKGKDLALNKPSEPKLTYKNDELKLNFTLKLKKPVKIAGQPVKLAIYDPEFFIAFLEPKNQKPMQLASGTPANCMFEKHRASMDQTSLVESRLGAPMDLTNEENKGAGALFAPSFQISCLAN